MENFFFRELMYIGIYNQLIQAEIHLRSEGQCLKPFQNNIYNFLVLR